MSGRGEAATDELGGFLQIGGGARLSGKLKGRGVVVCCGELRGEAAIDGDLIVTAEGALDVLTGGARQLALEGRAKGLFKLRESLEILPGGRFEGEVETKKLVLAPGGAIDAELRVGPEPGPKAAEGPSEG